MRKKNYSIGIYLYPIPVRIEEYTNIYWQQVIDLITGIQQREFGIQINIDEQPDLKDIAGRYQKGKGNFISLLSFTPF